MNYYYVTKLVWPHPYAGRQLTTSATLLMAESFGVMLASGAGFRLPLSTFVGGVEFFVSISATHIHKKETHKLTTNMISSSDFGGFMFKNHHKIFQANDIIRLEQF